MALIACEECKREISSRATACPHCGCPVSPPAPPPAKTETSSAPTPPPAKTEASAPPVPEVKVRVEMPPGLGAATATAIKGAASSPAWERLYRTLRGIALVWLAACGVGAVILYGQAPDLKTAAEKDSATIHQPQLYDASGKPIDLAPEAASQAVASGQAGFLKTDKVHIVTSTGQIGTVTGAEAPKALRQGARLATEDEINRARAERRQAHVDEQVQLALLAVLAGVAPIGILAALRRWWRWLRH
jgi:hypothetical protein